MILAQRRKVAKSQKAPAPLFWKHFTPFLANAVGLGWLRWVAEQVACFPNKWEVDLRPEVPDVDSLTADARREFGLDDTGKPLIARYIARKLTARKPPVVPPSLKIIIEKAVLVEWEKSCLQSTVPN